MLYSQILSNTQLTGVYGQLLPYAQLARIHKPTGNFAVFWPYLIGYLYTISYAKETPTQLLGRTISLFVAAAVERAAGCAWNDIVDRDYDRLVERCKKRPLARGALDVPRALCFTLILTGCWWASVLSIQTGKSTHLLLLTILVVVYPFCKRYTHFAQVFLGITFSYGIQIGADMSGCSDMIQDPERWSYYAGLWVLSGASTVWCIIYDTIYAFQDVQDDQNAGLKSTAVLFQRLARPVLVACTAVHLILLSFAGSLLDAGAAYYVLSIGGTTLLSLRATTKLQVDAPMQCAVWFSRLCVYGGLLVSAGMLSDYAWKISGQGWASVAIASAISQ